MKFTINRRVFADALALLTGSLPRINTSAISSSILVKASRDNANVTLVATNVTSRITIAFAANVTEDGAYAMPANYLLSVTRALISDTISFSSRPPSGAVKIAGGSGAFSMLTMPADDFPPDYVTDLKNRLVVKQTDLLTILEQVAPCVRESSGLAEHEAIAALANVLVTATPPAADRPGSLTVFASDGRLAATNSIECHRDRDSSHTPSPARYLLPDQLASDILRMGTRAIENHDITIAASDRHLALSLRTHGPDSTTRDIHISGVLMAADNYKDFSKPLSQRPDYTLRVGVAPLLDAIARVALASTRESPEMRFVFDETIINLAASSSRYGGASDSIRCESNDSRSRVVKQLIPSNITRLLNGFTGSTVDIGFFDDAKRPLFFRFSSLPHYLGATMPIVPAPVTPTPAAVPAAVST